nr:MAG TPA: portal protein [Caudoviricetes sp.]
MSLVDWLRPCPRVAEDHTLSSGYAFLFGPTTAGVKVTERSAMQMTAVYSCVRIQSEAIAGLPLHVYEQPPRETRSPKSSATAAMRSSACTCSCLTR